MQPPLGFPESRLKNTPDLSITKLKDSRGNIIGDVKRKIYAYYDERASCSVY